MSSTSDARGAAGLKDSLRARSLVGTFLKVPRREVVDLLALAGADFVVCDMEHGQVAEHEAREVVLAGLAHALPVIVRVPVPDPGLVNRLLEYGADGIQLPHIRGEEDGRWLRRVTQYPPEGERSASLNQPAAAYGTVPVGAYLAASNRGTLCVGQLESPSFDSPVEALMRHLDVAFVGGFDLSVESGVPGQVGHPVVRETIAVIEEAARRTGTPLGMFAGTTSQAEEAIAAGYRYVTVGSDLSLLSSSARETFAVLREKTATRSGGSDHD